jgi:hypothetical protein
LISGRWAQPRKTSRENFCRAIGPFPDFAALNPGSMLVPEAGGTRVRMEQSGFRPQDENNMRGAAYSWQRMVAGLERVTGEQA